MILEVAHLSVRPNHTGEFELAFRHAQTIIAATPGYISHELQRGIEHENEYILLVRWETLENHIDGFRGSPQYQEWKKLLHHFYEPFPVVLHYEPVLGTNGQE